MEDRIREIIGALISKTRARQVMWRESGRYGEYLLMLGDSSITIANSHSSDNEFNIKIFNNRGSIVIDYRATYSSSVELFTLLSDLYVAVTEYCNQIDSTLLSILQQLNSQEVVGNK